MTTENRQDAQSEASETLLDETSTDIDEVSTNIDDDSTDADDPAHPHYWSKEEFRGSDSSSSIVKVIGDRLCIFDKCLGQYEFIRELGRGANGIVYLVKNTYLQRQEALKVWVSLKENDKRDKFKQGILEAQKMAAAASVFVAQIYSADVVDRIFYVTMEYIKGSTLKTHLATPITPQERWMIARLYLNALRATTTENNVHGDPHESNIIVQTKENANESMFALKLLDFGTSHFARKEFSLKRHWSVVDRTIRRIVSPLSAYRRAQENMKDLLFARGRDGTDPLFKFAYYDDFLDGLSSSEGVHPR